MSILLGMSEAASLAIHTMAYLANNEERRVPNNEIASFLHGSIDHLAKVLGRLSKAGLIRSTRGPSGGSMLLKPAEEIKLLEIFEAIEGSFSPYGCPLEKNKDKHDMCPLGSLFEETQQKFYHFFSETTVRDFAVKSKVGVKHDTKNRPD